MAPLSRRRSALPLAGVLVIAASVVLTACGNGSGADEATLVLDFVPGPVHAGIYRAIAEGYYEQEGLELEIVEPTSTADTLKLIAAGKANFGIVDGLDLATEIGAGRDAKGILALTQRPLGGLITLERSGYGSPADLEGATIGVTGVPSDDAVLETLVSESGGDPASVERITIGFNGIQSLASGKIDAFTGYIPADGVQLEVEGFPTTSFALDEYGGPRYAGLVVFSTEERIASDPELIQDFVTATVRGYEDVIADPQVGVDALLEENPAIRKNFAEASLEAYLPLLQGDRETYGAFDPAGIKDLSAFMVEHGLTQAPIEPDRYATNQFAVGAR
jgi:putative hydroxymethylpyrimidine transport system substrate-binding protein